MVTNATGRIVGERGPGVLERPNLGGGGGGTGVLERPGFDQSQFEATPSAEEGKLYNSIYINICLFLCAFILQTHLIYIHR